MKIKRALLYPFSLLYGTGVTLRNLLYRLNIYKSIPFDLPLISVGNLSMGGTGKTPHVEYLLRFLMEDYRVATLSRGYRRRTSGFFMAGNSDSARTIGDEPMQYHYKFPNVQVAVGENRVLAIPEILAQHPATEVILLDDAFQHRAVKPGLQILLTTFQRPFFEDYILPAGTLREWRTAKDRADIIIVTKCPQNMSVLQQKKFVENIRPQNHQEVYFSTIKYQVPRRLWGIEDLNLSRLDSVVLVTGIANNQHLIKYLKSKVGRICTIKFPDHHYFTIPDLEKIKQGFDKEKGQKAIITTEKDAMRLLEHMEWLRKEKLPVYYLPIAVQFLKDKTAFDGQVLEFIENFAATQKGE